MNNPDTKRDPDLDFRLDRLEDRFPGIREALKEERLEVATNEELKEIRERLDRIVEMMAFQARITGVKPDAETSAYFTRREETRENASAAAVERADEGNHQ